MNKKRRTLKDMKLSTLLCLTILIAVLVPLTVTSVLAYRYSARFLLSVYGGALHTAAASVSARPAETPEQIADAAESTLSAASPAYHFSYFVLQSDNTIAASGCVGGNIFPLELFPTEENLQRGCLLHTNAYRGRALYVFTPVNPSYNLVAIYPLSNFPGVGASYGRFLVLAFLLALVLAGAAVLLLRKYHIIPAKNLVLTMRNPAMDAKITPYVTWRNEVGLMCASYLERFREYRDSLEEIKRLNEEQRTSEIEVLQNQINAHFIYNTLNNIQWLASANRMEDVVRTAQSLDILLRACAKNDSDYVTIEEEMTYVEAYLSSQKIRFHDIFDYEFQLDPFQMQMKIPKFIVQPIVENSIYHGFLDAGRGNGHIRVSLHRQGYRIVVEVHDNGVGIAPEHIFSILNNTRKSSDRYMGVAIGNINKRIRLLCGREFGIGIESRVGEYTKVQIIVPIIP